MKLTICLIISGLIAAQCLGQTDSTVKSDALDSAKQKSTLTAGITGCNNADYYGQRALTNLPYVAAAATYRFGFGLYFTGMAYRLLNDSSHTVSAENIGAGIALKLANKLTADLSYSHTFYPNFSPFLQAANPDNATAALTFDNWLTSTVTGDYAFGKSTDFFLTVGTAKTITMGSIGKKDVITFTPAFDVVGGTQHFYQTYITEKRLEDSLVGAILAPLTGDQSPGSSSFTKTITQFNFLSYNLKLPLAYNRASYLFEIQYQVSLLSNKAETGAGKINSFLSASFYYQF
jgi:hypothetical protein